MEPDSQPGATNKRATRVMIGGACALVISLVFWKVVLDQPSSDQPLADHATVNQPSTSLAEKLNEENARYQKAYAAKIEEGDLNRARQLLAKAKIAADQFKERVGDATIVRRHLAILNNDLGIIEREKGNLTSAKFHGAEAVESARIHGGSDSVFFAVSLINYGITLKQLGSSVGAEAPLRRAVGILEAAEDGHEWELARALMELGELLHITGRNDDARPLLERARTLEARVPASDKQQALRHFGGVGTLLLPPRQVEVAGKEELPAGEETGGDEKELASLTYEERLKRIRALEIEFVRNAGQFQLLYGQGLFAQAVTLAYRIRESLEAILDLSARQRDLSNISSDALQQLAVALANLCVVHGQLGQYAEAAENGEAAERLREMFRRPSSRGRLGNDARYAGVLVCLGNAYSNLLRQADAETKYRRAEDLLRHADGNNGMALSYALHNLGRLLRETGRTDEALTKLEEALELRKARMTLPSESGARGEDDDYGLAFGSGEARTAYARTLAEIAHISFDAAQFGEAEPLLQEALIASAMAKGLDHPDVLRLGGSYSAVLMALNRYDHAETIVRSTLDGQRRAYGESHPDLAASLSTLSSIFIARGQYEEAEVPLTEAVAIYEDILGGRHPRYLEAVRQLAELHLRRGRTELARSLLVRAVASAREGGQAAPGGLDRMLASLALAHHVAGRDAEALALYDELAPKLQDDGAFLHNKSLVHIRLGQYEVAEDLLHKAATLAESNYGPTHPDLADTLAVLGGVLMQQDRLDEAAAVQGRAAEIFEASLGPRNLRLAGAMSLQASAQARQERYADALATGRRAVAIAHAVVSSERSAALEQRHNIEIDEREIYLNHVHNTVLAIASDPAGIEAHVAEGFRTAQLAHRTAAGSALARMAGRFAAGDTELAGLVRQRQDGLEQARALERRIAGLYGQSAAVREAAGLDGLWAERDELQAGIEAIDTRLRESFPDYAELTNPRPVEAAAIQRLLAPDEAMLVYLIGNQGYINVWVARQGKLDYVAVKMDAGELTDWVEELREGVDLAGAASLQDLPRFDTRLAHDLYQRLFARIEPMLQGARTVMIVPDGALSAIPFGLLVTAPQDRPPVALAEYRDVPWLLRRYATLLLPSVASLPALRGGTRPQPAEQAFVGFGDPVLTGADGETRGADLAGMYRGGKVDVAAVRKLAPLPSTADELRRIAHELKAPEDSVLLQGQATERQVKGLDLSRYRVVSFATHGLLAGELAGLPEPALVLTPPAAPAPEDDGLLTASEIARLKLNADWVVLSACNTAAGERPGAEGLSGLAKAFFYAGSRALLVSHWPVASSAAVSLTTQTFATMAAAPEASKARALQAAKLAMIADETRPEFAHPAFWAPFVLVGDDRPVN